MIAILLVSAACDLSFAVEFVRTPEAEDSYDSCYSVEDVGSALDKMLSNIH